MARGPIVPPVPVAPPPRLVTLRITEPEAALVVRALRSSPEGPAAHRLADVLQHEVVLTTRGRERPR